MSNINIHTTIEGTSGEKPAKLLISEQGSDLSTLVSIERPVGDDTGDTEIVTIEIDHENWRRFRDPMFSGKPKLGKAKKAKPRKKTSKK